MCHCGRALGLVGAWMGDSGKLAVRSCHRAGADGGLSTMRPRRRAGYEEPPRERAGTDDLDGLFPRIERREFHPEPAEPELSTAAERAAARRRLDRLADEF